MHRIGLTFQRDESPRAENKPETHPMLQHDKFRASTTTRTLQLIRPE
jgi:hypothetical protein